jgi:hypothetical protein
MQRERGDERDEDRVRRHPKRGLPDALDQESGQATRRARANPEHGGPIAAHPPDDLQEAGGDDDGGRQRQQEPAFGKQLQVFAVRVVQIERPGLRLIQDHRVLIPAGARARGPEGADHRPGLAPDRQAARHAFADRDVQPRSQRAEIRVRRGDDECAGGRGDEPHRARAPGSAPRDARGEHAGSGRAARQPGA